MLRTTNKKFEANELDAPKATILLPEGMKQLMQLQAGWPEINTFDISCRIEQQG